MNKRVRWLRDNIKNILKINFIPMKTIEKKTKRRSTNVQKNNYELFIIIDLELYRFYNSDHSPIYYNSVIIIINVCALYNYLLLNLFRSKNKENERNILISEYIIRCTYCVKIILFLLNNNNIIFVFQGK